MKVTALIFYQYKDIVSIVIPLITIILLFISNYYKNSIIVFSILPTVFWHYGYKNSNKCNTIFIMLLNILTYFINQKFKYKKIKEKNKI